MANNNRLAKKTSPTSDIERARPSEVGWCGRHTRRTVEPPDPTGAMRSLEAALTACARADTVLRDLKAWPWSASPNPGAPFVPNSIFNLR